MDEDVSAKREYFPGLWAIALDVEYDQHRVLYESVEGLGIDDEDWVSPEEKARAIATESVVTLRWYPDTPVAYCYVAASTLAACLAAAIE